MRSCRNCSFVEIKFASNSRFRNIFHSTPPAKRTEKRGDLAIFPTQSIPLYFPFSPSFSIFSALQHFLAFALDFPRSAESHTFVFELDFEFSSTSTTHDHHSFSVAIHCHQFGSRMVVHNFAPPTTKFEQKSASQKRIFGGHI